MLKDRLLLVSVAFAALAGVWLLNDWAGANGISQELFTLIMLNAGAFVIAVWRLRKTANNHFGKIAFCTWSILHFAAQWLLIFQVRISVITYAMVLMAELAVCIPVLLVIMGHQKHNDAKAG